MPPLPADPAELPENVRVAVGLLVGISLNLTGRTEREAWQVLRLTVDEYEVLVNYLKQPGEEDLMDCWNMIRFDFMTRMSLLAVRLPTVAHNLFTAALQKHILAELAHHSVSSEDAWFLRKIQAVNAERATSVESLVYNTYRPDLTLTLVSNRASTSRHRPALVVEVCNDDKYDDMPALAERYFLAGGDAAHTRTVVAIDTTRGVFSVWRWLRYLPTPVGGRDYRRCVQTQKDIVWLGVGEEECPGLELSVRDFMPTRLPLVYGVEPMQLQAIMRKKVVLRCQDLAELWVDVNMPHWGFLDDDDGDEMESMDMELSSTEADEEDLLQMPDPEYWEDKEEYEPGVEEMGEDDDDDDDDDGESEGEGEFMDEDEDESEEE